MSWLLSWIVNLWEIRKLTLQALTLCTLKINWYERFQTENREWKILCCILTLSSIPQIWCFHVVIREFTKRRRLQQRQRQKAVIWLVKGTKMIVLHVRSAFLNDYLPYSSKLLHELTKFKVLTTTWTNYSESLSLTLYFKSVPSVPIQMME